MIKINMFKDIKLKGYSFIEGFPGAGLVGPMTISYMVDKLKMKYAGYVEGDNFPPLISIHKRQPVPPIRVYYSEEYKIVTIFAEFAITLDLVSELSDTVYKFICDNGISGIYSIGGIPMQMDTNTPFAVTSNAATAKKAASAGLKPIEEGVATGISALLIIKAAMGNLNEINIMIPVKQNIVDPGYAETAIQSLNKLLNLKIDVTDLDKEAKAVQAKIKEIINKHKESHENYKNAIDNTGPSMYA